MVRNITFGVIFRKAKSAGYSPLKTAYIELTHRCNFKCCHCYVRSESSVRKELAYNDYCNIAEQLLATGCMDVALTGGEPILHKDFFEIYSLFKRNGFLVTVMTNGYALNDQHFEYFAKNPPKAIEISLYGVDKCVFQKTTDTLFEPEYVLSNIDRLKRMNIKVYLKSVLMQHNWKEIDKYKALARKVGTRLRYDLIAHTDIYGKNRGFGCTIDAACAAKIQANDKRRVRIIKKSAIGKKECSLKDRNGLTPYFKCGIGKSTVVIDPYGYVYPCLIVRHGTHNVLLESINDIRRAFAVEIVSLERSIIKCDTCELHKYCPWCDGIIYLNKGDTGHLDTYCNLTMEFLGRIKETLPNEIHETKTLSC